MLKPKNKIKNKKFMVSTSAFVEKYKALPTIHIKNVRITLISAAYL